MKPNANEAMIEHMRFGLTNVQETIRFVDQKVGGAMAIVGLFGGVLLYGDGFAEGLRCCLRGGMSMPCFLRWSILVLAAIAALLFALGVWFAISTLIARGSADSGTTFLFPFAKNKAVAKEVKVEYENKLQGDKTKNLPCEELVSQLSVLAIVLRDKINSSRLMCQLFGGLLIVMTVLRVLVFCTIGK